MRAPEEQKVAAYTGEGAYHNSSKTRSSAAKAPVEIPESAPTTLSEYAPAPPGKKVEFHKFAAHFPNLCEVKKLLPVPTQEELQKETITFVWTPFKEAQEKAGPVTKTVLDAMEPFLERKKKYAYIDSKVQFFHQNDLPVDSKLWHVDGTIAVRDQRAVDLGYTLLHDMKARLAGEVSPPKYLAYQSSYHCATQFVTEPVSLDLSDFIANFEILDEMVRQLNPAHEPQPAGSIVSFDGFSLHRAVPATEDGWRLWIRCIETDRVVISDPSILGCYNTVFQQK